MTETPELFTEEWRKLPSGLPMSLHLVDDVSINVRHCGCGGDRTLHGQQSVTCLRISPDKNGPFTHTGCTEYLEEHQAGHHEGYCRSQGSEDDWVGRHGRQFCGYAKYGVEIGRYFGEFDHDVPKEAPCGQKTNKRIVAKAFGILEKRWCTGNKAQFSTQS